MTNNALHESYGTIWYLAARECTARQRERAATATERPYAKRATRYGSNHGNSNLPRSHPAMPASSTTTDSSGRGIAKAQELKNHGNDAFRKVCFCAFHQGGVSLL